MHIQAKGWGWAVLFVTLAMMLVVMGASVFFTKLLPDPHNMDRAFDQLCAVWLLLSAVIVFGLDRYREGKARRAVLGTDPVQGDVPREDEFLYMRMRVWPYVLAALGVWALIASYFV